MLLELKGEKPRGKWNINDIYYVPNIGSWDGNRIFQLDETDLQNNYHYVKLTSGYDLDQYTPIVYKVTVKPTTKIEIYNNQKGNAANEFADKHNTTSYNILGDLDLDIFVATVNNMVESIMVRTDVIKSIDPHESVLDYSDKLNDIRTKKTIPPSVYKFLEKYSYTISPSQNIKKIPPSFINTLTKLKIVPSKPIKIYRGISWDTPHKLDDRNIETGMVIDLQSDFITSWSKTEIVAESFATQRKYGIVLSMTVNPNDVLLDVTQLPELVYKTNQYEIILKTGSYKCKIESLIKNRNYINTWE